MVVDGGCDDVGEGEEGRRKETEKHLAKELWIRLFSSV